jgi:hypothetical protein
MGNITNRIQFTYNIICFGSDFMPVNLEVNELIGSQCNAGVTLVMCDRVILNNGGYAQTVTVCLFWYCRWSTALHFFILRRIHLQSFLSQNMFKWDRSLCSLLLVNYFIFWDIALNFLHFCSNIRKNVIIFIWSNLKYIFNMS